MTISRAEILKELLPGLNQLFGMEYEKFNKEMRYRRELLGGNSYVHGVQGVKNDTNYGINNA
jgi:hypothetical protein